MPDARLIDLAARRKHCMRRKHFAEVHRMLADPKAAEFAETFPHQWLQLRRVGMFAPDKVLYPDYDEYLEKSMIAEPILFFRDVLTRNGSLREFLESDWTISTAPGRPLRHQGRSWRKHAASDAQARKSSRRCDDDGIDPEPDFRRHAPSPGASRCMDAGIDHRQTGANPARKRAAAQYACAHAPKTTLRQKLESHRADPNCRRMP